MIITRVGAEYLASTMSDRRNLTVRRQQAFEETLASYVEQLAASNPGVLVRLYGVQPTQMPLLKTLPEVECVYCEQRLIVVCPDPVPDDLLWRPPTCSQYCQRKLFRHLASLRIEKPRRWTCPQYWKLAHATLADAERSIQETPTDDLGPLWAYACLCGAFHVGHHPREVPERDMELARIERRKQHDQRIAAAQPWSTILGRGTAD